MRRRHKTEEKDRAYRERIEDRRWVIGLRLCGLHPFWIKAETGLSLRWIHETLRGAGRVHTRKPHKGRWEPYKGIREHYALPAFLPFASFRMFGQLRPVCEVTPQAVIEDYAARFQDEHFEWCRARQRERDARRVRHDDATTPKCSQC